VKNVEDEIRSILEKIEGGPLRSALEETPRRVQVALEEMLSGYSVDIDSLFKTFDGEGKDQLVIARKIHAYSTCEHHLLPFEISVSVAYLPIDKVIGVSKMVRLVLAFARRLQLQERLTEQIAETLMERLNPAGVAVVIKGEHLCMRMRGVKSEEAEVVTSVMLGKFREEASLRAEFLHLIGEIS